MNCNYYVNGDYKCNISPNQIEGFSDSENWELHETGKECKIHDTNVGSSSKSGNWYSNKNLTLNECKNECKDHKFMDWKEGRKFKKTDIWGKSYWFGKNRSYQNDSARAWCECSNECEPKEYSAYDIYVNKNWDTIMEEKYCGSNENWVNGQCVGQFAAEEILQDDADTFTTLEDITTPNIEAPNSTDLVISSTNTQPSSIGIDSKNVSGFTLSSTRSKADLNLDSEKTLSDTKLTSPTTKGFDATIDDQNTTITPIKERAELTFSGNPTISNYGETAADISEKAIGAGRLSTNRGSITASFEGKAKDFVVNAAKTKKPTDLSYEKEETTGNFNLRKGADELVFGG